MQIQSTPPQIDISAVMTAKTDLLRFQVGQMLKVMVVGKTEFGQYLLDGAGSRLLARSSVPLPTGTTLTLRVSTAGQQPILQVVDTPVDRPVHARALRVALPAQAPLPPALDAVATLARGETGGRVEVPRALMEEAARLLARLPDPATLTRPRGVREAIRNSGLFLEAKLAGVARESGPVAGDLKAGLLRLAAMVARALPGQVPEQPPAPARETAAPSAGTAARTAQTTAGAKGAEPEAMLQQSAQARALGELAARLDGALYRVQVQQLHTVSGETQGTATWHLEIPVRDGDRHHVLGMRIRREGGHDTAEAGAWSVDLHLDTEELGPLHARIGLASGTVHARFWAEREGTADLLGRHLHELRERLGAAGLEVGALQSRTGTPDDGPEEPPLSRTELVDERA